MTEYIITVRKIVPLTEEEKRKLQDERNGNRGFVRESFTPYQYGMIPLNEHEERAVAVLDVKLDEVEYEAIKKAVIEVKK